MPGDGNTARARYLRAKGRVDRRANQALREGGSQSKAIALLQAWRFGDPELQRDLCAVAAYEAVHSSD